MPPANIRIVAMMTPAITTKPMTGARAHTLFAVVFVLFHAARAPAGNAVNVVAPANEASILYQIMTPMMMAIRRPITLVMASGMLPKVFDKSFLKLNTPATGKHQDRSYDDTSDEH